MCQDKTVLAHKVDKAGRVVGVVAMAGRLRLPAKGREAAHRWRDIGVEGLLMGVSAAVIRELFGEVFLHQGRFMEILFLYRCLAVQEEAALRVVMAAVVAVVQSSLLLEMKLTLREQSKLPVALRAGLRAIV